MKHIRSMVVLLLVAAMAFGLSPSLAMDWPEDFEGPIFVEGNVVKLVDDGPVLWRWVSYDGDSVEDHRFSFPEEIGLMTQEGDFLGVFPVVGFLDRDREDESYYNNDYLEVTAVVLPAGYVRMPYNAFEQENILETIEVAPGNPVLEAEEGVLYHKAEGWLLAYPSARAEEHFVVREGTRVIGPMAFGMNPYNEAVLKSVTLPEGLERIAYRGMRVGKLSQELILPASLKVIEDFAFENTVLGKLTIPDTLEGISGNPFAGGATPQLIISKHHPTMHFVGDVLYDKVVKRLLLHPNTRKADKALEIEPDTLSIGSGAFVDVDLSQMNQLTIPDAVVEIGARAFAGAKLQAIQLPDSLQVLGHNAFSRVQGLREIVVPGGVARVRPQTFAWTSTLEKVVLMEGIEQVDRMAFESCGQLTGLSLPSSLKVIGERAFGSCPQLAELVLPDGLRMIGEHAFMHNTALKSLRLPEGLEQVEQAAFYYCEALEEVYVPGSVKRLPFATFGNNGSLQQVTLSEGLEEIGRNAFSNCGKLSSLTLPRSLIALDEEAFLNTPVTLQVYPGSPAEALVQEMGLSYELIP